MSAESESHDVFCWSSIRRCLAISPLGFASVAIALIIGFYHGLLKRSYPGILSTFAFDLPLVLGLVVVWRGLETRRPLFTNSRTAIALKFVILICFLFFVLPSDVPWLIRIASLRGWLMAPLMFLVGYHVLKTPEQLRLIGWLTIALSVAVTIYGMMQDPSEILKAKVEDEGFVKTINGATYTRADGRAGFRVFSTFVGAGMFAMAVTVGCIFAVAEVSDTRAGIIWRLLFAGAIGFCLNGILISGSRSSVLTVTLGCAVVAWLRGAIRKFGPILLAIGIGAGVASSVFKIWDLSRMSEAFSPAQIYGRSFIVIKPSIYTLLENPFGHGLGTSTHGVPVVFLHLISGFKAIPIDGDLGHAAVDLGLVGMVAYTIMIIRATRDSLMWAKAFRGTESETIAIMGSAIMVLCLPAFITGTPFLHVPVGALDWYFIGAINRIYDERHSSTPAALGTEPVGIRRAPKGIPSGKAGHSRDSAVALNPPLPKTASSKPGKTKRFLFK